MKGDISQFREYKSYIRPIISFGASVWVRPLCTSSAQMEKLRIFERGCLRITSNTYRAIGSYMRLSNSKLYEKCSIQRIDNFMINNSIRFFEKTKNKLPQFGRLISLNPDMNRRYKPIDYVYLKNEFGTLRDDNGRIDMFNRAYSDNEKSVYSVGQ